MDEKGKAKVLNVVCLKKMTTIDEPVVMPVRKRDTQEEQGRNSAKPNKKREGA